MPKFASEAARVAAFWSKVTKRPGNGCWEFKGGTYGNVWTADQRLVKAHRFAWMLEHGDPGKALVLHDCDNPPCVRVGPGHLRLGTYAENMRDCVKRGRNGQPKGSLHPRARLSEQDIPVIRALLATGEAPKRVAWLYGMSLPTIYAIRVRKIWKHVP